MQDTNIVDFPAPEVVKEESQEAQQPEVKAGFTMIMNALLEAMCEVRLSGRQHEVFNSVVRKTIGFHKKFAWISAEKIALQMKYDGDQSHIYKDLRALKSRKILVSDDKKIGVNLNFSEWQYDKPTPKTSRKRLQEEDNQTSQKQPQELAENGHETSQKRLEKVAENGIHKRKKETNLKTNIKNNTPCNPPLDDSLEESKPKPKAKRARPKPNQIDLSKLPSCISLETAQAFIDHRKAMKKPVTEYGFYLIIKKALDAPTIGLTPNQAIDEAIMAGWQGINLDWIAKRVNNQASYPTGNYNQSQQQTKTQSNWNEDLGW